MWLMVYCSWVNMVTVRNRYFKYKEQYENSYFENTPDKELACESIKGHG